MTRVPSGALVLTIEESPPCVVGPISRAGALPSAGRIAIRPWPSEAYTKRGRLDCDTTWAVVLDRVWRRVRPNRSCVRDRAAAGSRGPVKGLLRGFSPDGRNEHESILRVGIRPDLSRIGTKFPHDGQ